MNKDEVLIGRGYLTFITIWVFCVFLIRVISECVAKHTIQSSLDRFFFNPMKKQKFLFSMTTVNYYPPALPLWPPLSLCQMRRIAPDVPVSVFETGQKNQRLLTYKLHFHFPINSVHPIILPLVTDICVNAVTLRTVRASLLWKASGS